MCRPVANHISAAENRERWLLCPTARQAKAQVGGGGVLYLHCCRQLSEELEGSMPGAPVSRPVSPGGVVAALCDAACARGALCSTSIFIDVRRALKLSTCNRDLHAVWVAAQRVSLEQVVCAGRAGDAPGSAAPRAACDVADLVLLHTDVDMHRLITDESVSLYEETAALHHLWQLIQRHRIEEPAPKRSRVRAQRWTRLHKDYTASGRIASIIVLQRRWYELKLQARERLAAYWKQVHPKPTSSATPKASHSPPTAIRVKRVAKDPMALARKITASATLTTVTDDDDTVIIINPRPIATSATEASPAAAEAAVSEPQLPQLPRPAPLHISILKRYPHVARAAPTWRQQVAAGLVVTQLLEEDDKEPSATGSPSGHDRERPGGPGAGRECPGGPGAGWKCPGGPGAGRECPGGPGAGWKCPGGPGFGRAAALADVTHMYRYYRATEDSTSVNESDASAMLAPPAPTSNNDAAATERIVRSRTRDKQKLRDTKDTDEQIQVCSSSEDTDTEDLLVIDEDLTNAHVVFKEEKIDTEETETEATEDVTTTATVDVLHTIDPTKVKTEIVFESDSGEEDQNQPFLKDIKDEILLDVKTEPTRCLSSKILFDDEMPTAVVKTEIKEDKDDAIDGNVITASSDVTDKKEEINEAKVMDKSEVIENKDDYENNAMDKDSDMDVGDVMDRDDTIDGLAWDSDLEMDQLDDGPGIDSKLLMESSIHLIKLDETPAWKKYAIHKKSINVSRINKQLLAPKTSDKINYMTNRFEDNTADTDSSEEAFKAVKREFIGDESYKENVGIPLKKSRISSDSDDDKLLLTIKNEAANGNNNTNIFFETAEIEIDINEALIQLEDKTKHEETLSSEIEEQYRGSKDTGTIVIVNDKHAVIRPIISFTSVETNDAREDGVMNKGREDKKGRNSCHSAASTLEWSDKFDPVFGDAARVAKRVELPNIEEVRRINSNILTAQVAPITTQAEGAAPAPAPAPAPATAPAQPPQQEPTEQDDGVPSGEELEAVLYELSTMTKAQQVLEPAHCCAARREREVNDARRRIGLADIPLHNHNGAACTCCCAHLCSAGERHRLALQLQTLHDDITKMLKGIPAAPTSADKKEAKRVKDRERRRRIKESSRKVDAPSSSSDISIASTCAAANELSTSAACAKAAPKRPRGAAKRATTARTSSAVQSTDTPAKPSSVKNLPTSAKPPSTDKTPTTANPTSAKPTAGGSSASAKPAKPATAAADDGYDEWMRQKTLHSQYFHIQGTNKAHLNKQKTKTPSNVASTTSVTGPAVPGPAALGPADRGPAATGPAASGPPVPGPVAPGPAVSTPAVPGLAPGLAAPWPTGGSSPPVIPSNAVPTLYFVGPQADVRPAAQAERGPVIITRKKTLSPAEQRSKQNKLLPTLLSTAKAGMEALGMTAPTFVVPQLGASYVKQSCVQAAPKETEAGAAGTEAGAAGTEAGAAGTSPKLPNVAAPSATQEPQLSDAPTESAQSTSTDAHNYPKISVVPFENLAEPTIDKNPSSLNLLPAQRNSCSTDSVPQHVQPQPSDTSCLSILEQYSRTLAQEAALMPSVQLNTGVNALSLQIPGPRGPQTTIIMAVTLPPEQVLPGVGAPSAPTAPSTPVATVDLTSDSESSDVQPASPQKTTKSQRRTITVHKVTSGPPLKGMRTTCGNTQLLNLMRNRNRSLLKAAQDSRPGAPDDNVIHAAEFEQSLRESAEQEEHMTFIYKQESLRVTPSQLPRGSMLLCIDALCSPLQLSDDPIWNGYLLFTDKRLPCKIPTYWTINAYSSVARVVSSQTEAVTPCDPDPGPEQSDGVDKQTKTDTKVTANGLVLEKVDASNTWRIVSTGDNVNWRARTAAGKTLGRGKPAPVHVRSSKRRPSEQLFKILTAVSSVTQFRALALAGAALHIMSVCRGRWCPLRVLQQPGGRCAVHCDLQPAIVLQNLTNMLNDLSDVEDPEPALWSAPPMELGE